MSRDLRSRTVATLVLAGVGIALLAPRALANWTSLPGSVQVVLGPTNAQVATAPDGLGGMYVAWVQSTSSFFENGQVAIQHFDRLGNALWTPGGLLMDEGIHVRGAPIDMCPDNAGGVWVCWTKYISNILGFTGNKVRADHVSASGFSYLGGAMDISGNAHTPTDSPAIASDGLDGAIITWIDYNRYGNAYPCNNTANATSLVAARVNGSGVFSWGTRVSPAYDVAPSEFDVEEMRALTRGSGVYFVWTALNSSCQDMLVKIQRLDLNTGSATFDPAGVVLYTGSLSTALAAYLSPTTGADCLVTVMSRYEGVWVDRVASSGAVTWSQQLDNDLAAVGTAMPDGQNGVLATWFTLGWQVQAVGPAGQLRFPGGGGGLSRSTLCGDYSFFPVGFPPHVVPDGKGGAILAVPCDHPGNTFREIYCQGVNDRGRPAFRSSGLQVSISGQAATAVSACPGFINTAMFAWGNANGVWAQGVSLSNLDVLSAPPGWAGPVVPRASGGATFGSVGATALIEGNQTWLNWVVAQRGPNPTAAFQVRVYLDGLTYWGQSIGDGAVPGYYPVTNYGPFNIPGGLHTLTLYADEEFGPDWSIDEASEADDVWGRQWLWEPAWVQAGGPITGSFLGFKGSSMPPNGNGHKILVPGKVPGTLNAWVVSNAARRGPRFDGATGALLGYGDSYGLMLYDLPAGAVEFTNQIGESHQPYNGTNFMVSMVPDVPDSLYPLEVRDSTEDATPDSSRFDFELAGTRAGPAAGSSWLGQVMVSGGLADVYVLAALRGQTMHLSLVRHESPGGGDSPLRFEVFAPALEGPSTLARGGGTTSLPVSADIETLMFVAPRSGPHLVVVYRPDGSTAGAPVTYDFQSSQTQTLDVQGPRLELAFAGAEPNPVHAGAEFAFTTPVAGTASLVLYDVGGRTVRALLGGTLDAGRHRVRWDGRGADGARLRAGLYFARFSCGDKALVRRVVMAP